MGIVALPAGKIRMKAIFGSGDSYISRIVCASDCSEFAVIRNDDYSDDPVADPFEREQVAHTH